MECKGESGVNAKSYKEEKNDGKEQFYYAVVIGYNFKNLLVVLQSHIPNLRRHTRKDSKIFESDRHECWKGCKIAKTEWNAIEMKNYAKRIRKFQRN